MNDRTIDDWGRVLLSPDTAFEMLYKGLDISKTSFSYISTDMEKYNELCVEYDKLDDIIVEPTLPSHSPEEEHKKRSDTWLIPKEFLAIDMYEFLINKCKTEEEKLRVEEEYKLFKERNLIPILQTCVYLIDHFRKNDIVWGVGRGSSVASFCLYLIGVHKLNPLKFGFEITEFLR